MFLVLSKHNHVMLWIDPIYILLTTTFCTIWLIPLYDITINISPVTKWIQISFMLPFDVSIQSISYFCCITLTVFSPKWVLIKANEYWWCLKCNKISSIYFSFLNENNCKSHIYFNNNNNKTKLIFVVYQKNCWTNNSSKGNIIKI